MSDLPTCKGEGCEWVKNCSKHLNINFYENGEFKIFQNYPCHLNSEGKKHKFY